MDRIDAKRYNKFMKILYIITSGDDGGAQKYVIELAQNFGGAVAAGDEKTALFKKCSERGIQTFTLKSLKRGFSPLNDFRAILEIKNLINTFKPDIVHLNSTKAGILGSLGGFLAKENLPKIVFTAHGFHFLEPGGWLKKNISLAAEKMAGNFRDFIIAVSETDRLAALEHNLINENSIRVIHNGIKNQNFLPAEKASELLKLPNNKIHIGSIGGFYQTKGFDILIKAVELLDREIKEKIVVSILGDGPELENCKSLAKAKSLESIIIFSGMVENAAELLKAFDIFIIPSRKEGLPFVLLEAMQAGLPIVATKVGGIPEALKNNGLLIQPQNPKDLSGAISTLVKNSALRKKLGEQSLNGSKEFGLEKMLGETKLVYQNLLK